MLARLFVVAAAMAALAPSAHAQFTGVVVPPRQAVEVVPESVAVIAAAQADRQTQLTDMRAWVDSAAASLGVQGATADTTAPAPVAAPVESHEEAATSTASMSTGMRAPDTATLLPMVMLIGAVFLSAGTFLVCTRRPRPHESATGAGAGERHA